MEKVNFGHVCFAAATMTGTATFASFMGHITDPAFVAVMGTAVGTVVLSVLYANFK